MLFLSYLFIPNYLYREIIQPKPSVLLAFPRNFFTKSNPCPWLTNETRLISFGMLLSFNFSCNLLCCNFKFTVWSKTFDLVTLKYNYVYFEVIWNFDSWNTPSFIQVEKIIRASELCFGMIYDENNHPTVRIILTVGVWFYLIERSWVIRQGSTFGFDVPIDSFNDPLILVKWQFHSRRTKVTMVNFHNSYYTN